MKPPKKPSRLKKERVYKPLKGKSVGKIIGEMTPEELDSFNKTMEALVKDLKKNGKKGDILKSIWRI